MIAYEFHPKARLNLDEIWEFIRDDNPAAADNVIEDILCRISESRQQTPGPYLASPALLSLHTYRSGSVWPYMWKAIAPVLCLLLTSCRSGGNASEIGAALEIRTINSAETAFRAEHGRFGTLDELPARHGSKYAGYRLTLQLRPNGYVIQAQPERYGAAGVRSYYSDESRVIRQAWRKGPATASDSPIDFLQAAPAAPSSLTVK
jgi:plasmid stabilization system protein ParE